MSVPLSDSAVSHVHAEHSGLHLDGCGDDGHFSALFSVHGSVFSECFSSIELITRSWEKCLNYLLSNFCILFPIFPGVANNLEEVKFKVMLPSSSENEMQK